MGLDSARVARRRPAPGIAAGFRRALDPEAATPVPKHRDAGIQRIEPPERTVARLLPRLAGFGITRVARITGFDRTGVEVVSVARPNARALSVANGKGLTLAAAKASGIMEAVERWHAERPALPLRFGDPDDLAATGLPVQAELPRLRADAASSPGFWAPALDLATGEPALVPFDAVHTCWLASMPDSAWYTSTNGLAAGSHPVEATLHGLCETVERDACALFDALPAPARTARRIDLGSIDPGPVAALVDRLTTAGFAVALWDTTTDVGVPVLLAALVDAERPRSAPGLGSGCHPDRTVAALRALTEAAQTRAIAIAGTRDDLSSDLYAAGIGIRLGWALGAAGGAGLRRWSAVPTRESDDLRDDLGALLRRLARAGCGPALAVDLSRGPGISVVRLLVPGLEAGSPGEGVLPGRRAGRVAEIFR
jgi:ribosomal protein S12 methylthiotransferase accessory factor